MNAEFNGNWIFAQGWEYLRWSVSIVKKVAAIVPGYTVSVVCASLVSQISLVLAFFLPLKIVLLIATPGIPRYFPAYFANYDRDMLALALGLAAAGFYILYLISNRIIEAHSERGADLLLHRARKLALFANQEGIAKQAYQRFAGSIATLLFAGLGLLGFAFVYPPLSAFLVTLLLLYVLVISIAGQNLVIRDWITKHIDGITEVLAALFFLSACTFIVLDFVLGSGVNLIVAIICLLLSRQIAQRLSGAVSDAIILTQQKPRVNALFFHSKALVRPGAKREEGFWTLMDKERRREWLREVLEEVVASSLTNIETWWHQTGLRGVAGLNVKASAEDATEAQWYFVKLFDARQRAQAIHEATLLGDRRTQALPAPSLLTTVDIEGFQCLVFEPVPEGRVQPAQIRDTARELMTRSWEVEPPDALVNRYRRSKPLLVDRLDDHLLHRLRIVFNTPEQGEAVDRFESRLDEIGEVLSDLPLFIYNPDVKLDMIRADPEGSNVVTHWGKWSLEPVGAGWPVIGRQLEALDDYLTATVEGSRRLAGVRTQHARLAALMFAFDRFCNQESYLSAVELLPDILACLDAEFADIDYVKEAGTTTS